VESDPRWANPIKNRVKQSNQARAINEVVNALKPSQSSRLDGPLRVVNGMSTTTSSTLTTAARENVPISVVDVFAGRPGGSTIRWGGGLQAHPELREHEEDAALEVKELPEIPVPRKSVTPSLATLEKAVSARIYFENHYFPLFRHPPSREQRRLAMERDMTQMQLSENQKEHLRARWRQNETEYLRELRSKVDVSAFIKLKTIGHGTYTTIGSFFSLLSSTIVRRLWRRFSSKGKIDQPIICYEGGEQLAQALLESR
jgi:protein-serine/threonine kinase